MARLFGIIFVAAVSVAQQVPTWQELDAHTGVVAVNVEGRWKRQPSASFSIPTWNDLERHQYSLAESSAARDPATRGPLDLRNRRDIMELVRRESCQAHVRPDLALAIAHAESNFFPRAMSTTGCCAGVFQLNLADGTAQSYGIHRIEEAFRPDLNVPAGISLIRDLSNRFAHPETIAAAFFAGDNFGPKTLDYARRVSALMKRYEGVTCDLFIPIAE